MPNSEIVPLLVYGGIALVAMLVSARFYHELCRIRELLAEFVALYRVRSRINDK